MNAEAESLAAEDRFFGALLEGDTEALGRVLGDDFILIDVMTGSEIARPLLLAVVGAGQLRFDIIERAGHLVRVYQTTAVITGRTRIKGRFADIPFATSSRYTHVYVEQHGEWRLVAAQGTQIAPGPELPTA
ncbi:MAG: nuclear transport factor 2 family protein [Acidobacteriia bacterium]|nr:nuclear transport factor 2 family protein [Terriglobia bacterium]